MRGTPPPDLDDVADDVPQAGHTGLPDGIACPDAHHQKQLKGWAVVAATTLTAWFDDHVVGESMHPPDAA